MELHSGAPQTQGLSRDLKPMNTPAPEWMPAHCRLIYPSWVQRKAVTPCTRDQKRGGTGNVQQYRLAIHDAVLASEARDHWTGEPLDWQLISTYDNNETAARKGAHKKQYAMLPTIDHRTLKISGGR
jgi:hypothetical protein